MTIQSHADEVERLTRERDHHCQEQLRAEARLARAVVAMEEAQQAVRELQAECAEHFSATQLAGQALARLRLEAEQSGRVWRDGEPMTPMPIDPKYGAVHRCMTDALRQLSRGPMFVDDMARGNSEYLRPYMQIALEQLEAGGFVERYTGDPDHPKPHRGLPPRDRWPGEAWQVVGQEHVPPELSAAKYRAREAEREAAVRAAQAVADEFNERCPGGTPVEWTYVITHYHERGRLLKPASGWGADDQFEWHRKEHPTPLVIHCSGTVQSPAHLGYLGSIDPVVSVRTKNGCELVSVAILRKSGAES